jgi:hypothetical protein
MSNKPKPLAGYCLLALVGGVWVRHGAPGARAINISVCARIVIY